MFFYLGWFVFPVVITTRRRVIVELFRSSSLDLATYSLYFSIFKSTRG